MAPVGALYEGRSPAPGVVAGTFALDLDHVGAEIGQNLPGPRTRQDASKFQHAYSGQGTRHRLILLRAIGGLRRQNRRFCGLSTPLLSSMWKWRVLA
jgi:hypothetical protein